MSLILEQVSVEFPIRTCFLLQVIVTVSPKVPSDTLPLTEFSTVKPEHTVRMEDFNF